MSVRIVTNNAGYGQNEPQSYDTASFADVPTAIAAIASSFLTFTVASPVPSGNPTGNPLHATETIAVASASIQAIVAL